MKQVARVLNPGFLNLKQTDGALFIMPLKECISGQMAVFDLITLTMERAFGIKTDLLFEETGAPEQDLHAEIITSGELLKTSGCNRIFIITAVGISREIIRFTERALNMRATYITLYDGANRETIARKTIVDILRAI